MSETKTTPAAPVKKLQLPGRPDPAAAGAEKPASEKPASEKPASEKPSPSTLTPELPAVSGQTLENELPPATFASEPAPEPTPEPVPPPAPPRRETVTVKAVEVEVSMERSLRDHLRAVAAMPEGSCTSPDLAKQFPSLVPKQIRQLLDAYVENGLLLRTWKRAAGRYSLTTAGQEKLAELEAKLS